MGRILRPQGLRGEVVVDLVTNRSERVAPGAELESDAGTLVVVSSRPHQQRWVVAFQGVADREGAERLRGLVLRAEPLDDPDALWVHELIGADVVDATGWTVGRVSAVQANPASDLIVLDGGGLIPLRFVTGHTPGRVEVDIPAGLLD